MESRQDEAVGPSIAGHALLLIARYFVHLTLICVAIVCAVLGLVGLMRGEPTALFAIAAVPLGFMAVRYGRAKVGPQERVVGDAIDRQEGQEAKLALHIFVVLLRFFVGRSHNK